jgi:peptidoglycan/xylan/chitin deacetylase (PgdA/CDA1 family)
MSVRRLPLPGWILTLTIPLFVATWVVAPSESLSGTVTPPGDIPVPPRAEEGAPILKLQTRPQTGRWRVDSPSTIFGLERSWYVAFTFDDGPHPIHTRRLLEVLDRFGVKATFFVNGYWMDPTRRRNSQQARAIVRRAYESGHTIANHTYSHAKLTHLSSEEQTREILDNHALITRLTGQPPTLFRPPYAQMTDHSRELIQRLGYIEARWSATAPDEEIDDPEELSRTVMSWLLTYNGGIVMLHDRFRHSVKAVELLLEAIKRHNCRRYRRRKPTLQVVSLDSFLRPPPQSWALRVEAEHHQHLERLRRDCSPGRSR